MENALKQVQTCQFWNFEKRKYILHGKVNAHVLCVKPISFLSSGEVCAGLYTRPADNVNRVFPFEHVCKEAIVAPIGQTIKLTFTECNIHCSDGKSMFCYIQIIQS